MDFANSKGKNGNDSSLRSRKLSLEQAEVATIVSGGFSNVNSGIPSVRESKDNSGMPKEPLQFLDPVTGQRKIEYRCYNIFTYKLPHMSEFQDGKENYGFLYCPNKRC